MTHATYWSLTEAAELCKMIESFAPLYDCHVALTGGCLYKEGPRRDVDVMFYRIRQQDQINTAGLMEELTRKGFEIGKQHGWVVKAKYQGKTVDFFFPEHKDGELYAGINAADGY